MLSLQVVREWTAPVDGVLLWCRYTVRICELSTDVQIMVSNSRQEGRGMLTDNRSTSHWDESERRRYHSQPGCLCGSKFCEERQECSNEVNVWHDKFMSKGISRA